MCAWKTPLKGHKSLNIPNLHLLGTPEHVSICQYVSGVGVVDYTPILNLSLKPGRAENRFLQWKFKISPRWLRCQGVCWNSAVGAYPSWNLALEQFKEAVFICLTSPSKLSDFAVRTFGLSLGLCLWETLWTPIWLLWTLMTPGSIRDGVWTFWGHRSVI